MAGAIAGGGRLLALRVSQYLMLFLSGLVVARALGPALRAEYVLPLVLANCLWAVVNLSLDTAAGRLLGRREASLVEVSRVLATATLGLGAVGAVATLAVGLLTRNELLTGASVTSVGLAALMVPLSVGVQQMGTGLLVRVGALRAYGWASAVSGATVLVLVTALAAASALTPERAIAAVVIGSVLLAFLLALALARHTGLRGLLPGGSRRVMAMMLSAGATLHLAWVAMFLNLRIDLFFVSALTTARETGLYSLSVSLAEIMFLASWTIVHSAAQMQTEADAGVAARYTLEFVGQSLIFVAVSAAVVAVVAYPVIVVVYGQEWSGSVLPFAILSFAAAAFSLEAPVRTLLARVARPSVVLVPAFAGLGSNVALNFALVPALGISGAALASLASYWLYAVLLLLRFRTVTQLSLRTLLRRPGDDDLIIRLAAQVRCRVFGHGVSR